MAGKLIRASVVILAEAHNPSILSPDWLKEKKIISENPSNFVHTPDFAVFESKTFSLIVDRQRLQLTAKKTSPKVLGALISIISRYFELLPHIPYLRLGLNFDWLVEEDERSTPPEIQLTVGSTTDFSDIFPDHKLCFGSIIVAEKNPYKLRLNIEPAEENALNYKFNFDYNIKDVSEDKRKEYIANIPKLYNLASSVVAKTTKLSGVNEDE